MTNVEPGLCGGTEFSNVRFKGDDARAEKLYENVEYVSPQDIANIVLWLNRQPEHVNINRIEVNAYCTNLCTNLMSQEFKNNKEILCQKPF